MLDLQDCQISGPALPPAFLLGLTLDPSGATHASWPQLRAGPPHGSERRVRAYVTQCLAPALGYAACHRQPSVTTRDGSEDGGWLLSATAGNRLRLWATSRDTDPDGGTASPTASRASPTRSAQRVLLASGETAGLLTNGEVLRLLLCDPLRADSIVSIDLAAWRSSPMETDSLRLLRMLVGAERLPVLPQLLEAARLHQVRVTAELRRQAREAVIGFVNALPTRDGLDAATLWQESLVLIYRLLFILKLESVAEPDAGFSFASSTLWRGALSPNRALAPLVRRHLDDGHDTGSLLEAGLRLLFRLFRDGLSCSELRIMPLGGALFGAGTTPLLDQLSWGDRAVALLLDRLI